MEERVVGVRVGSGLRGVGPADRALFRGGGGDGEDEGFGGVGGGLEGGEGAPAGEEDVVVLDLGLFGDGQVEDVFCGCQSRANGPGVGGWALPMSSHA